MRSGFIIYECWQKRCENIENLLSQKYNEIMLLLLITGCSAGRKQSEAENETCGTEVREDQPNTLSENIGQDVPSDSDQPQNLSKQEYAFVSWEDAGLAGRKSGSSHERGGRYPRKGHYA